MDDKELDQYCQFIRVINSSIGEHFKNQEEFICCREGCAMCCKNAQYPCSKKEFEFLKIGFMTLPRATQNIIVENVEKIKKDILKHKEGVFNYVCPFLINDRCSVYNFRMIICRTFGLAYYDEKDENNENNTIKVPFCVHDGLNYSTVYDAKSNSLSTKKREDLSFKNEPVAYNLDMKNLKEKFGKEIMNIDFGEEKALIDWFLE